MRSHPPRILPAHSACGSSGNFRFADCNRVGPSIERERHAPPAAGTWMTHGPFAYRRDVQPVPSPGFRRSLNLATLFLRSDKSVEAMNEIEEYAGRDCEENGCELQVSPLNMDRNYL